MTDLLVREVLARNGIVAEIDDLGFLGPFLEAPELSLDQRCVLAQAPSQRHQILDSISRYEFEPALLIDSTEDVRHLIAKADVNDIAHANVGIEFDIAGGQKHGQIDDIRCAIQVRNLDRAPRGGLFDDLTHPCHRLAGYLLFKGRTTQFVEKPAGRAVPHR